MRHRQRQYTNLRLLRWFFRIWPCWLRRSAVTPHCVYKQPYPTKDQYINLHESVEHGLCLPTIIVFVAISIFLSHSTTHRRIRKQDVTTLQTINGTQIRTRDKPFNDCAYGPSSDHAYRSSTIKHIQQQFR